MEVPMRKLIFFFLLCAVFILCSCAQQVNTPTTVSQPIQLTLAVKKDYTTTVEDIVSKFEEENENIQIKLLQLPSSSDDIHRILVTDLSSGQNEFDLFEIQDIWIAEFASSGYIRDLSEEITIHLDEYLEIIKDGISYNDKLYAVPFGLDLGMMFYNKNLTGGEHSDWESLLRNTKIFNNGQIKLFVIQGRDGEDMICNLMELVKYKNNDIEQGLVLYKQLIDESKSVWNTENDYTTAFKSGNAAYMRSWISTRPFLSDDLSKVKNALGIKPILNNMNEPVSILKRYGLAISTKSKYFKEAVKFLEFCIREDNQQRQVKENNLFPMLKKFYSDEMIIDYCPYIAGMLNSVEKMQTRRKIENYMELSAEAQKSVKAYLAGEINVKEAVKVLQPLMP